MTDEELVRALAQRVCGWEDNGAAQWTSRQEGDTLHVVCDFRHFNPLENDADAMALLDKMVSQGLAIVLSAVPLKGRPSWAVKVGGFSAGHPAMTRNRAICEAVAKAVGIQL